MRTSTPISAAILAIAILCTPNQSVFADETAGQGMQTARQPGSSAGEELAWQTDFGPASAGDWVLQRKVPGAVSLAFPAEGATPGLSFSSDRSFDILRRPLAVGTRPFELAADFTITRGSAEVFNRARGVLIVFSSAPVDAMGEKDVAYLVAVTQTGPFVAIKQGGARYGSEIRPKVWAFTGRNVQPRFEINMGGAGGQDFSVRWPTKSVAGTRLRFWIGRTPDGKVRFRIHNADGLDAPWWEAETALPQDCAETPLQWLTLQTSREAGDFRDLSRFTLGRGQGNGPLDGLVDRLQVRTLAAGEEPRLDVPFPSAVAAAPVGYTPHSALLDAARLATLRAKFNAPQFADYRTMLLRCAEPPSPERGHGAANEDLLALAWAYVLTGDRDLYWTRILENLDALSGVSDRLPAQVYEYPGHLRQQLNIREFSIHNMATLAIAYDLVGPELDPARRDHIRHLLLRTLRAYHALLDDGDWWYGQNPSNTIGVGNGGVGIVAAVLLHQAPELARRTIDRALGNIRRLFLGVEPDGGSIEGSLYWQYGLAYPSLFGWALRQVTGDDAGLLASPQVLNASAYVAVNFGGDGGMMPFNDTQPWLIGWPVLAAAGTEGDDDVARWFADHMAHRYATTPTFPEQTRSTYTVAAFLYRDSAPAPAAYPGLPNVALLESVQEAALRSDGSQLVPLLVTGVKGKGLHSTHHANEDQGSFVFYAGGEAILIDPGYFEPEARQHSLPLIGDPRTMALDPTAPCPLSDAWESGSLRSVTVDSTAAYRRGPNARSPLAERVRRVFVQVGDEALVILDDIQPTDPQAMVTLQFQAGVPVTMQADGSVVFAAKAGPVVLRSHGSAVEYSVEQQTFHKDWVYAKLGVPWSTVSGTCRVDVERPLVSVLTVSPEGTQRPVHVRYGSQGVDVSVGNHAVRFRQVDGVWKAVKP